MGRAWGDSVGKLDNVGQESPWNPGMTATTSPSDIAGVFKAANGAAFYLVRHGETEWNAAGRYQGAKDSPLTLRGREQAHLIGRTLASSISGSQPLRAYVSPLGRARETAAIIAETVALDIQIERRIAEVSAGVWDGMSMYEIDVEFPGALAKGNQNDWYFESPDGESFEAALARVSDWLKGAIAPALIVTHGLASRLVRGAYEGLSRNEMLKLPVPQDGFFELAGGRSKFIRSV
jgi:probable phosphoglycerate mutase